MLWIEDIVESTQVPSFSTNFRVDLASFVDPHKVVARRSAFLALPNVCNGGELEGGVKSGRLKCKFSQVEGDLDCKRSLNQFPFQRKEH